MKKPPEAPKPWHVLPILAQGDAEAGPLYTAVGKALTQWERMDQVQANMFGILVGSRLGAATLAYGTISASSTRGGMVLAAAELVLRENAALQAETIRILQDIGELGARRNEIAHGVVSHSTSSYADEHGTVTRQDHGHFLMPASYAVKYRSKKKRDFGSPVTEAGKYAYTSAQVMVYATHFAEHYKRLVDLMWRIISYCDTRWPPEAFQPPA